MCFGSISGLENKEARPNAAGGLVGGLQCHWEQSTGRGQTLLRTGEWSRSSGLHVSVNSDTPMDAGLVGRAEVALL